MGSHKNIFLALATLAICTITSMANQPPPLQDFCVFDRNSSLFINGFPCKDPTKVDDNDFYCDTTLVAGIFTLPGLNTLGLEMFNLTFEPSEINAPHLHPRGSELVYVLEGTLKAGFVGSGPEYRYFSKILNQGDVFIIPPGMIHFQLNVGKKNATAQALVFFNSNNRGFVGMQDLFFTEPALPVDVLAKSFQVDQDTVKLFQSSDF